MFFWRKTILKELRILNCQVLCLRFSKAMTLNYSSFVHYSWKSLFLQNILKGLRVDQFFKIPIHGIISPSHHFEKEIYQYVNIKQVAKKNIFLKNISQWLFLTGKHLCWSLFLTLSIAKFLRACILKNVCERLLQKMCS